MVKSFFCRVVSVLYGYKSEFVASSKNNYPSEKYFLTIYTPFKRFASKLTERNFS
jgi:hypothetical protein